MPYDRILICFLAVFCIAAFISYMQYSRTGRALRALAQDRSRPSSWASRSIATR